MNGFKRYFLRITFALAIVTAVNTSCSDNFESSIPHVGIYLDIRIANHNNLTVVGGAEYFAGYGYGGIWVVRGNDDSFYAYDATCPYEVDPTVLIDCDGGVGTCPKCGTLYFMLEGGYVLSGFGPGTEQLKSYSTTYSGGIIYIRN